MEYYVIDNRGMVVINFHSYKFATEFALEQDKIETGHSVIRSESAEEAQEESIC